MWEKIENFNNKITSGLIIKDLPVLLNLTPHNTFGVYHFSIIMTQMCDLESFYRTLEKQGINYHNFKIGEDVIELGDRQIISQIILCPAFDEDKFYEGIHLEEPLNIKVKQIEKKEEDKYKQHIRYQYLKSNKKEIPNLFVDFKQYFTLPIQIVQTFINNGNMYKLNILNYTDLADRFSHYLQRVPV